MNKFKLSNPWHLLATGFGAGLITPAPGTWGSLAGVALLLVISLFIAVGTLAYWLLTLVICVTGIMICERAGQDVGEHDHAAIVWDEIAGIFVCFGFIDISAISVIVGFVLFRVFDILKPWPIGWLDKNLSGGLGVMVDDLLAGLAAAASYLFLVVVFA